MSTEIKKQLVQQIKHKVQIIEMLEQELTMEGDFVREFKQGEASNPNSPRK